jgi:hypothetical protein
MTHFPFFSAPEHQLVVLGIPSIGLYVCVFVCVYLCILSLVGVTVKGILDWIY